MTVLLIASDVPGAGKTAVAAGLALALQRAGHNAAVCKPLSSAGAADPDAVYYAAHFGGDVAVASADDDSGDDDSGMDDAANAVRALSGRADPILVEVANPAAGSGLASGLLAGLAEGLEARIIAVIDYRSDLTATALAAAASALGNRLAGVIINRVPRYRASAAQSILDEAAATSIPLLAALPERREMLSVSLNELSRHLNGRWERQPSDAEVWIDRFLIGGNMMDSGVGYFGRHQHQAVIARAERPDIQMASLTGNTRCLILTGGGRPTEYIRVEAAKHDVSILLVDDGTVATADAIGGLPGAAAPHCRHKAELMADALSASLDVTGLLQSSQSVPN